MKGVILAGGTGSRLYPLTRVTNKHLLPVFDRPMIFYPLQALINAGIKDILVVTGGQNAGEFLRLLGNGKGFGLKHVNYTYQEGEGGIADALRLAEHFADEQPICVALGDNIIERNIIIDRYSAGWRRKFEAERAKVIAKNAQGGAETEALLGPTEYQVTFFKNCQAASVTASDVWQIKAKTPGASTKVLTVPKEKRISCVKVLGSWVCP